MQPYVITFVDEKEMPEYTWKLSAPTELDEHDKAEEVIAAHSFGMGGNKPYRKFIEKYVIEVHKKGEEGDHKAEAVKDVRFKFTSGAIMVRLFLQPPSSWRENGAGQGSTGT